MEAEWSPSLGPLPSGLHAVNVQRVAQEGSEHAHGIAAAAHTGAHGVRKQSGHFQELFPASTPMHIWKSRTIWGKGWGPTTDPMQ